MHAVLFYTYYCLAGAWPGILGSCAQLAAKVASKLDSGIYRNSHVIMIQLQISPHAPFISACNRMISTLMNLLNAWFEYVTN